MELELIGEGNTAEVYTWKEGQILKLFRKEFPLGGIEKEYRVNKEVEKLGLPIPKAEGMIDYNGRTGIIYDRVTGESVLNLITTKPWKSKKYIKRLVELQYEMHQCKAENLTSYKEALEWNINHNNSLSDQIKQSILEKLANLPEGDSLCHGDFHPGNVIKTTQEYVILDWMTAASGNPSMDVARTVLLLRDAGLPGNIPAVARLIMGFTRRIMASTYLKGYKKLSGVSQEEIDSWRLPIIAARLMEWVPESERTALIKEINKTL